MNTLQKPNEEELEGQISEETTEKLERSEVSEDIPTEGAPGDDPSSVEPSIHDNEPLAFNLRGTTEQRPDEEIGIEKDVDQKDIQVQEEGPDLNQSGEQISPHQAVETFSSEEDAPERKAVEVPTEDEQPLVQSPDETGTAMKPSEDIKPAPDIDLEKIQPGLDNVLRKAKEDKETKSTDTERVPLAELKSEIRYKVREVFIESIDYENTRKSGLKDQRVFIVQGPPHAGKFTCAIHLGLELRGEIASLDNLSRVDIYTPYENGLNHLLSKVGLNHPDHSHILVYEQRLRDNIRQARRHGEDDTNRVKRAEIVDQLNNLALSTINTSFNDLCEQIRPTANQKTTDTLVTELRFKIYKRKIRDSRSLTDIVRHPDIERHTICLVRDAFENGVKSEHLSPDLFSALADKESFLILTTTYQDEQLKPLPPEVCTISTHSDDKNIHLAFMYKVFEKHLNYYGRLTTVSEEVIELAKKEKKKLLDDYLKWPFQVDQFCGELSRLTSEADTGEIIKLAERIGRIDQKSTRSWFEKLPDNAQFYAMLVILFEDVDRFMLDEIYSQVVRTLREDGVSKLSDPRAIGLDDMLEYIRAQESETRSVRFNNLAFEQEVRRQIHNHHHLLWSFINVILELIETFKTPEYWEFRKALGTTIGRLGIYHIPKLHPVLEEKLALHPHGGVVAVIGYTLDEICHIGPEYYAFVTQLLDRWVASGDPDLMWAAGASSWRIYDGLARAAQDHDKSLKAHQALETVEHIWKILEKLAENFDHFSKKARHKAEQQARQADDHKITTVGQFVISEFVVRERMQNLLEVWATANAQSVLHAIRQIALIYPQDVVEQITRWLKTKKDSNLYRLGQIAGLRLFVENAYSEIKLLEEQHQPLLGLISPLLSTTDETTVDTMVEALLIWLQHPGWADKIHQLMLYAVNRATVEERSVLRRSLSHYWLNSASEDAQRLGQSLIIRSYAMDGVPMEVPGHYQGIIALDASKEYQKGAAYAHVGWELYWRLNALLDMRVVHMGRTQILNESRSYLTEVDLRLEHVRSRLLFGPLGRFDPLKVNFVLVFAENEVLDVEDLWQGSWSDRLVITTPKRNIKWPENLTVIPVDYRYLNRGLATIENNLRLSLARILTTRQAEEWRAALSKYFPFEGEDIALITDQLDRWIIDLDDIRYCNCPNDIVRIIMNTILWLAAMDLPKCVRTIQTWLNQENELARLVGTAGSRMLFRVYAPCDPVPPIESYAILLELASPFTQQAKQDWRESDAISTAARCWDKAEAVLYAARQWAVQPEWADRLLMHPDGGPSELIQLVDAVLPENSKALKNILTQQWGLGAVPAEGTETVPKSVRELGQQLHLRILLGTEKSLPDLPSGHTYGVVIVDISGNKQQTENFEKLISDLIKQLTGPKYEHLHLLLYRLGQNHLLMSPDKQIEVKTLIPARSGNHPRLVGPLLEKHLIDQVSFVLWLTNRQATSHLALDEEDWDNTRWSRQIYVYSDVDYPLWNKPFTLIPKSSELEQAKQTILAYLFNVQEGV